jgi:transcription antitermination factor NusG
MIASPSSPQSLEYLSRFVRPWRVLRCQTGKEFDVEKHLSLRGIEPYLPTYKALKRFPDRRPVPIVKPLFFGYIFATYHESERHSVLTTPFVIDVLTFGQKQAEMEPEEMERLRAMGSIDSIEPWTKLENGARIRVTSGPLSGAVGRILSRKGGLQVVIEIAMLGRAAKCVVDGWEIERL